MANNNIPNQDNERNENLEETSIRGMLESLHAVPPERCIYRVPIKLREVNVKAYTPRTVSIGPFHHGDKNLQAMEEHKLRYLKDFLGRTGQNSKNCVEFIVRGLEEKARRCYGETINLSPDQFAKVILVDGGFVVELLLTYTGQSNDENNHQPWVSSALYDDMMLLENQLPFFVLENLFNLIPIYRREGGPSFLAIVLKYFKLLPHPNGQTTQISSSDIKHFVDFIHHCHWSSIPNGPHSVDDQGNARYDYLPTVTELQEAGVRFRMGHEGCSLFDIKFTNGKLEIPQLVIWDMTETFFRNLIAFEQCHRTDQCISNYMFLFDGLIGTRKDVDLLIHKGIIKCNVGNGEDVLALFNNICKHVVFRGPFYYSSLCKDLSAYCGRPWHRWKATLKRDYCNTPWKVVSISVAVLLLLLTFVQAVCSIIKLAIK